MNLIFGRKSTMDMKTLLAATVAAGVALFAVDLLLHMIPFIGGHHPHGHHEHADMSVWGALGALLHGLVLAVVLAWRGVADMKDGAIAGAAYGVLLSLAHSIEAGDLSSELVGAAIGSAIVVGIGGMAVALVLGGRSSN